MKNSRIHFMGIGGAGASAAAAIAKSAGFTISGCDISKSKYFLQLARINIKIGHNPNHLRDCQILVITPAILKFDPENSELIAAKSKKIPIITWQEFMGKFLQNDKKVIAVAGTHGKSTTTAMIGHILEDGGFDPTVEVGAVDLSWGKNFRVGVGDFFVCEADEYNNNFLNYKPEIGVVTNIEFDHPDFFDNVEQIFQSFIQFVKSNPKLESLFVSPQEAGIKKFLTMLLGKKRRLEYLKLVKFPEIKFKLKLAGSHNLTNANLAAAVGERLRVQPLTIRKSLENFKGLERRFQFIGKIGGTFVFDDFAHHPTEIETTLVALKQKFPKKKVCLVFQPHTYSRTKALLSNFVKVFKKANLEKIIFSEIFASREKDDLAISAHDLAAAVGAKSIYISSLEGVGEWLLANFAQFDCILTAGAGDVGKIWDFKSLKVKLSYAKYQNNN